jgi:hypothetical protein
MPSFRLRLVLNSGMPFERTVTMLKQMGVRCSAAEVLPKMENYLRQAQAGFVCEQYEARTILTPTPPKPFGRLFPCRVQDIPLWTHPIVFCFFH